MATCRLSKPNDPMYGEGPQSYSPHWARQFVNPPLRLSHGKKNLLWKTMTLRRRPEPRAAGATMT